MYSALDLYASVALLLVASAVLGQGVLCACGRRTWSWLAPAVGLATLVIVAGATIRLPGRDLTAMAAVGIALAASIAVLWIRRPEAPGAFRVGLPIVVAIALAASLPFAAAGGFGAFEGKSNDLGYYLYDAQWLQTHDGFEPSHVTKGFPMGPPALAVVTAEALGGASFVATFTAFMIVVAVAGGLASLTVFGELGAGRRTLAALLVGFPYMAASFYVGSSFKEVAMGMFALAFALTVRELAGEDRPEAAVRPGSLAALVPLGLLAGAAVYTYSFAGTYWPLGMLGLWVLASLLYQRRRLQALVRSVLGGDAEVGAGAHSRCGWARCGARRGDPGAQPGDRVREGARLAQRAQRRQRGRRSSGHPLVLHGARRLAGDGLPRARSQHDRSSGFCSPSRWSPWRAGCSCCGGAGSSPCWPPRRRQRSSTWRRASGPVPTCSRRPSRSWPRVTMLITVYGALTVFAQRRRGGVPTEKSAAAGAQGAAERLLAAPIVWPAVALVFLGRRSAVELSGAGRRPGQRRRAVAAARGVGAPGRGL